MQTSPQSIIDLPGIKKLRSGKVREGFDLGKRLLFVATDRFSAFDVILPDPIPSKGPVLNQLFAFWGGNRKNSRKISRSFPPPNE
jgi:phosphoribosylaminoimidazole-succinocarboxamide synthase